MADQPIRVMFRSGLGGLYEKHHFEVGEGRAGEELWESA
jgi:hypothetical protein